MRSEYDPLLPELAIEQSDDLERVQDQFAQASRPYLSSPWTWLAWGVVLPVAALATPRMSAFGGPAAVLLLWSGAILLAGLVEFLGFSRSQRRTPLGAWVLRIQGNLSMVALVLSLLLIWYERAEALPGIWLLLLGHSFYLLGGLAFPPLRLYGLAYQLGGVVALWPGSQPLLVLAVVTAIANFALALAIFAAGRGRAPEVTGP